MSNSLRHDVIEVVSYARFHGGMLSVADCIHLHQWANQNIQPSPFLKDKFNNIQERIKLERWQRPELQYNSQLRLMYRHIDMENYKEVPNQE